MNQMYGFDGEVKAKYNAQMAELFTEVYNWLPLCHCLNNRVLVSAKSRTKILLSLESDDLKRCPGHWEIRDWVVQNFWNTSYLKDFYLV